MRLRLSSGSRCGDVGMESEGWTVECMMGAREETASHSWHISFACKPLAPVSKSRNPPEAARVALHATAA